MPDVHTRVAVVTGASRGLGAVLAAFLAGDGYDLVLTARGRETLEATAREVEVTVEDVTVRTVVGDVTDPDHRAAVEAGYLWHEFGDTHLLL